MANKVVNFSPINASCRTVAVTSTSQAIVRPTPSGPAAVTNVYNGCFVQNTGDKNIYVEFGRSTVTATVPTGSTYGSHLIPAGEGQLLGIPSDGEYIGLVTASGETSTAFIRGVGA